MQGNFTTKVTKEEVDLMIKLYSEGLGAAAICKYVPYTAHTVLSHLRKAGIEIRSKAGYKKPFKENYFEEIDTEKKAYFLGFLMADGCVITRDNSQPCIALQIKSDDKYILEELKKELDTDCKISCNNLREHSSLKVHSQKMMDDLSKYGIVPRKTGHERFPLEQLPTSMVKHFVRGFFDGDGWVTLTSSHGKPNRRLTIGFTGNKEMLSDINNYFKRIINNMSIISVHEFNKTQKGYDGFSSITYSKLKNVVSIFNWMYEDATIFLSRKKKVFDSAAPLISSRLQIKEPA